MRIRWSLWYSLANLQFQEKSLISASDGYLIALEGTALIGGRRLKEGNTHFKFYTTKIEPHVESCRHYLKMKTYSKDLRHLIRVASKYQIKYVWNSENHSANNTYISTSNLHQELSKDDHIENKSNTGDYEPAKPVESNKTNYSKRNNSSTRKK